VDDAVRRLTSAAGAEFFDERMSQRCDEHGGIPTIVVRPRIASLAKGDETFVVAGRK
jgi:hypothetical protein